METGEPEGEEPYEEELGQGFSTYTEYYNSLVPNFSNATPAALENG